MANVFIQDSTMSAIGDAIRAKTGSTDKLLPADMAAEIASIETGSDIQLIEGMEIPLDFSAGDQSLAAPDGQAVKTATIKKPTTLVPQNIANGVNIAGVVGTLESGGSGGGGISFLANKAVSTLIYSVSETPIVEIKVPTDATNISYWQKQLTVHVLNSGYTTIKENYVTIPSRMIPYSDMTVSDAGNGYKLLRIPLQVSFPAYSGAYIYQIKEKTTSVSLLAYTMPTLTIEDNVLYASADCNALMYQQNYSTRLLTYYLEEIDLRGSNITHLPVAAMSGVTELKKVWLPEKLTYLDNWALCALTGLQELHFTSTTPPSMYSSSVWENLPTSCKIYVPAGTLSAYTSKSSYPSSSTYTYIEE